MQEEAPKNQFESPEAFENWVVEKAKESNDYFAFYHETMNSYLDFLLEGGLVKMPTKTYIPALIIGESYKIAFRNNKTICEIIDLIYKQDKKIRNGKEIDLKQPYSEIGFGRRNDQIEITELIKKYTREATGENIEDILETTSSEDLQEKIIEYKNRIGNLSLLKKLREISSKLNSLNETDENLQPKIYKLMENDAKTLNHITYASMTFNKTIENNVIALTKYYNQKLMNRLDLSVGDARLLIRELV